MRIPTIAMLLTLVSPILADCPRVPGEEDDRRANAGCLILQDGQVLLVSHRWGGKLGVPGGTFRFRNTWNHTEVTDPTSGETRPISGVRPSQAVISFEQDITGLKLQWGAAYIPILGQKSYNPDQTNGWSGHDYFELWGEYKPTETLAIRAQVNIWNDFDVERTVYADRVTRPIAYVEHRYIDPRTFFQVRVRKTF